MKFRNANELIRVGGSSKSELLEECNLKNIKTQRRLPGRKGDIAVVRGAKIVGMTTTGSAKFRHIIDGAKPKITSNTILFTCIFEFFIYLK